MRRLVPRDLATPEQRQAAGLAHGPDEGGDAGGVDVLGCLAEEAEDHRTVGPVAAARRAEAPEQLDAHRRDAARGAVREQGLGNSRAAFIGPTVCELEGPMPILKRSNTEITRISLCGRGAAGCRTTAG